MGLDIFVPLHVYSRLSAFWVSICPVARGILPASCVFANSADACIFIQSEVCCLGLQDANHNRCA